MEPVPPGRREQAGKTVLLATLDRGMEPAEMEVLAETVARGTPAVSVKWEAPEVSEGMEEMPKVVGSIFQVARFFSRLRS